MQVTCLAPPTSTVLLATRKILFASSLLCTWSVVREGVANEDCTSLVLGISFQVARNTLRSGEGEGVCVGGEDDRLGRVRGQTTTPCAQQSFHTTARLTHLAILSKQHIDRHQRGEVEHTHIVLDGHLKHAQGVHASHLDSCS